MQLDLFAFAPPKTKVQPVKKTNWLDWVYTPEKPRPALDKRQIINVRFRGGWDSSCTDERNKSFGYWVDDFNCFKWQDKYPLDDIVAYQLCE